MLKCLIFGPIIFTLKLVLLLAALWLASDYGFGPVLLRTEPIVFKDDYFGAGPPKPDDKAVTKFPMQIADSVRFIQEFQLLNLIRIDIKPAKCYTV